MGHFIDLYNRTLLNVTGFHSMLFSYPLEKWETFRVRLGAAWDGNRWRVYRVGPTGLVVAAAATTTTTTVDLGAGPMRSATKKKTKKK